MILFLFSTVSVKRNNKQKQNDLIWYKKVRERETHREEERERDSKILLNSPESFSGYGPILIIHYNYIYFFKIYF